MKKNRLTLYIIISMILGILVGYLIHVSSSAEFIKSFSKNISLLGKVFIRLVQMIIAPLVFSTLVVGIAKLGDLKAVGRVGGKAMIWFISASLVSLTVGLILVNTFVPGQYIDLSHADTEGVKDLMAKNQEFSVEKFVEHIIPRSVIEAMATNEILQLVVFSIFFGVATAAMGEKSKPIVKAMDIYFSYHFKNGGICNEFCSLGCFRSALCCCCF